MKILVIVGHPLRESFCGSLAASYAEGARAGGADVDLVHVGALQFDPSLHDGYAHPQALEPDLAKAQEQIAAADHLAFFYPQWWGSAPAVLKGFVDRVFLPGFAFKYHAQGPFWDRLLTGKTGEIWLTSDSPWLWFTFMYWSSPIRWLKSATLEFCGVRPVKVTTVNRMRFLTPEQRQAWLARARRRGASLKA